MFRSISFGFKFNLNFAALGWSCHRERETLSFHRKSNARSDCLRAVREESNCRITSIFSYFIGTKWTIILFLSDHHGVWKLTATYNEPFPYFPAQITLLHFPKERWYAILCCVPLMCQMWYWKQTVKNWSFKRVIWQIEK